MRLTRRAFLQAGVAGGSGVLFGSTLSPLPCSALSASQVMTISYSGTACARDEGEMSRVRSDKNIYLPSSGYIPVRINKELGGNIAHHGTSTVGQTVRGVGENDWYDTPTSSEHLIINGPLDISTSNNLANYIAGYLNGNQYSQYEQLWGYSKAAMALHAANLAAASGAVQYNFIGHSRGAVESIMTAWFLYKYGSPSVRNTPVKIFAIDPVPGPGDWYGIFTQLPPNVTDYIGVYAWDHGNHPDVINHPEEHAFQALVPRPNGYMRRSSNAINFHELTAVESLEGWHAWMVLADDAQQQNPLIPPLPTDTLAQPRNYRLFACRGRHSTVAGNTTADSGYVASNASAHVAPVPALIYKMARGYLTSWGTIFETPSAVPESVRALRRRIHLDHREFDKMGGGETRNGTLDGMLRPYVRRISSSSGANPLHTHYMDDVVGDPPNRLAFPVTRDRQNAGWVNWTFL